MALSDSQAPVSEGKPLGKRLLRIVIWVAAIAFVFGWLLPQFIDYDAVWNAIKGLSWWQLLVLFVLAMARVPTEALIYRALLPGLGIWKGSETYLSTNVVAQFVPPPGAEVMRYAYFRAAGYDAQSSLTGSIGSFIFPTAGRIVLPLIAAPLLIIANRDDGETWLFAGISLALAVVFALVVWLVGRSERSALWFGAKLGRFVSWILVRFRRDPVGDLGPQVLAFRDNAYAVVRERWLMGSSAVALNLFLTYLILLVAFRFLDVSNAQLGWTEIFAAFALAFFAGAVIPITGSGLGIVDAVLISTLAVETSASNNVVVAAVLIWRLFYSWITLPIGAITASRFRKAHREIISEASSQVGGGTKPDGTSSSGSL